MTKLQYAYHVHAVRMNTQHEMSLTFWSDRILMELCQIQHAVSEVSKDSIFVAANEVFVRSITLLTPNGVVK